MTLTPPDFDRCQAVIKKYAPFIMGGNVHSERRCENRPHWLVAEAMPGPDAMRGSMTVCDDCAKVLVKQRWTKPESYTMDWITQ